MITGILLRLSIVSFPPWIEGLKENLELSDAGGNEKSREAEEEILER